MEEEREALAERERVERQPLWDAHRARMDRLARTVSVEEAKRLHDEFRRSLPVKESDRLWLREMGFAPENDLEMSRIRSVLHFVRRAVLSGGEDPVMVYARLREFFCDTGTE